MMMNYIKDDLACQVRDLDLEHSNFAAIISKSFGSSNTYMYSHQHHFVASDNVPMCTNDIER